MAEGSGSNWPVIKSQCGNGARRQAKRFRTSVRRQNSSQSWKKGDWKVYCVAGTPCPLQNISRATPSSMFCLSCLSTLIQEKEGTWVHPALRLSKQPFPASFSLLPTAPDGTALASLFTVILFIWCLPLISIDGSMIHFELSLTLGRGYTAQDSCPRPPIQLYHLKDTTKAVPHLSKGKTGCWDIYCLLPPVLLGGSSQSGLLGKSPSPGLIVQEEYLTWHEAKSFQQK